MKSPKGRLELTWMGKGMALIPSEEGRYDYEWVDRTDPRACEVKAVEVLDAIGEGADDNLLVIGDSGDALRSLLMIPEWSDRYRGKVKLAYIDPPFNTDQTFEHYADALEHSIWLTMIRDRLRDIKALLSADGSVWVHLDDAEVHRCRAVLDEEMGAENFLGTVIWQKADSARNDAKAFSSDHDSILVYAVDASKWTPNRLSRTAQMDAIYSSPDGDEVPWFDDNPTAPGAKTHQGMVYAIQSPFTGQLHYPARGRHWFAEQPRLMAALQEWAPFEARDINDAPRRAGLCGISAEEVRAGVKAIMLTVPVEVARQSAQARYAKGSWPEIIFRSGGDGGVGRKRYRPETGAPPRTLWPNVEVGHNRQAKAEIKALFPGASPFATPKPERLLERVLHIASNPGDIVLDCFAGSGTTAAVAHKMNRRWVTVELQERTVDTYTRPRLERVVAGTDPGGITSKSERVPVAELPEGVSPEDAYKFTSLLRKFAETVGDVDDQTVKSLRLAAKTKVDVTTEWQGGGGFTVARMGPSMYEVDDEGIYLSDAATNGAFSQAIAGQMRYRLTDDHPVFCGVKGRSRLTVVDGVADEHVVRTVIEHLGDGERAVIVAKAVIPEAAALLQKMSPGSRLKKAPEDIFPKATVR